MALLLIEHSGLDADGRVVGEQPRQLQFMSRQLAFFSIAHAEIAHQRLADLQRHDDHGAKVKPGCQVFQLLARYDVGTPALARYATERAVSRVGAKAGGALLRQAEVTVDSKMAFFISQRNSGDIAF